MSEDSEDDDYDLSTEKGKREYIDEVGGGTF